MSQVTLLKQRIGELETRTAQCKSDVSSAIQMVSQHDSTIQHLEKIDDLENHSCRNNLRFVGNPESFKGEDLLMFLALDLQSALGLTLPNDPPLIERAHRLGGMPQPDVNRPRPAIVKFLHYATKREYPTGLPPTTPVIGTCVLIFPQLSQLNGRHSHLSVKA